MCVSVSMSQSLLRGRQATWAAGPLPVLELISRPDQIEREDQDASERGS